jgi:hypothetical protein
MNNKTISVDDTIAFLNSLVELDRDAVTNLIKSRVECNESLARHPTVQVGVKDNNTYEVGILGIINGLFGIDEHGWGFIAATIDDEIGVVKFHKTITPRAS